MVSPKIGPAGCGLPAAPAVAAAPVGAGALVVGRADEAAGTAWGCDGAAVRGGGGAAGAAGDAAGGAAAG
ncbi:MAG TPA: hypothetical protein VOA80_01290, partial [Thermoanaerobaculia bacterium]|nr:hypothetical protein [Thermoanaerobaculia bacterium]